MVPRCLGPLFVLLVLLPLAPADDPVDGWVELQAADGRIRVQVPPGNDTHSSTASATVNGVPMQMHIQLIGNKDGAFGLYHITLPKEHLKGKDPQKLLDAMRGGSLQNIQGRVVSERRITYGPKKYPGRDFVADGTHKGQAAHCYARVYLIEGQGIALIAVGSTNRDMGKEVERFYKSFTWDPASEKKSEKEKPPGE